jgi:hypothetical protein
MDPYRRPNKGSEGWLRSLALIEPLGDAGIGTYTHELA